MGVPRGLCAPGGVHRAGLGLARGAGGAKGSEALWGGSRDKAWHRTRARVFLCDRSGKHAKGIALEIALSVPWLPLLLSQGWRGGGEGGGRVCVEGGPVPVPCIQPPLFPAPHLRAVAERCGRKRNPNAPVPITAAALSRGFCKSGRRGPHPRPLSASPHLPRPLCSAHGPPAPAGSALWQGPAAWQPAPSILFEV